MTKSLLLFAALLSLHVQADDTVHADFSDSAHWQRFQQQYQLSAYSGISYQTRHLGDKKAVTILHRENAANETFQLSMRGNQLRLLSARPCNSTGISRKTSLKIDGQPFTAERSCLMGAAEVFVISLKGQQSKRAGIHAANSGFLRVDLVDYGHSIPFHIDGISTAFGLR